MFGEEEGRVSVLGGLREKGERAYLSGAAGPGLSVGRMPVCVTILDGREGGQVRGGSK